MTHLEEPFLIAAREMRLSAQRCSKCSTFQLPPVVRCGTCGGREFSWECVSGRGSLASFTVLHRAPPEHQNRLPYVYALVDLEEGPRIISNIVGVDSDELWIGMPLQVVFERVDAEGQTWPEFAPYPLTPPGEG